MPQGNRSLHVGLYLNVNDNTMVNASIQSNKMSSISSEFANSPVHTKFNKVE